HFSWPCVLRLRGFPFLQLLFFFDSFFVASSAPSFPFSPLPLSSFAFPPPSFAAGPTFFVFSAPPFSVSCAGAPFCSSVVFSSFAPCLSVPSAPALSVCTPPAPPAPAPPAPPASLLLPWCFSPALPPSGSVSLLFQVLSPPLVSSFLPLSLYFTHCFNLAEQAEFLFTLLVLFLSFSFLKFTELSRTLLNLFGLKSLYLTMLKV
uniref:Uncharacterized protein n=1 Tax=Tetraodon nigroviridis TaxID=99883 RepID=H3D843_TETNG